MTPPNTVFDPAAAIRTQPGASGVPFAQPINDALGRIQPGASGVWTDPSGAVPKQDNLPAPANAPRPSPVTQLPQASAGVLDRINDYLKRNSNTLIGLGAGFAGSRSFGEGVSRAGYGALAGGRLDVSEQQRTATVNALMAQGYTRDQAEAMAGDKSLLKTQDLDVGPPGAEQKVPISVSPFGVRPLPINLGTQGTGGGVGPGSQIVNPKTGQVWRMGPDGKWTVMDPQATGT
jgi:hypothetical protein